MAHVWCAHNTAVWPFQAEVFHDIIITLLSKGKYFQKRNADFSDTVSSRITVQLKLEGTSGEHLVQPHCSSMATKSHLPRTMSRYLNMCKEGNSTIYPSNLCQCLVTLTVEKGFLMFRRGLPCFSAVSCPAAGHHSKGAEYNFCVYVCVGVSNAVRGPDMNRSARRYARTLKLGINLQNNHFVH